MRVGGNCLEYLKRGWNRKKGRERKILKGGGGMAASWVKGVCLKKGEGVGTLLQTMPRLSDREFHVPTSILSFQFHSWERSITLKIAIY